jgi:FKBP-type peptidyl-prolyl cis-trans isomerase
MIHYLRIPTRHATPLVVHRALFGVLLTITLAACGGGDAPGGDVTFDSSLNVNLDQMNHAANGLYSRDLTEGTGATATSGSIAVVHYTGWLPDGTEFDSSRRGQPFRFPVGGGQVIQGWDEGVAGMKVGGRRQLVIPPALGYGNREMGGVIPANSTLVFDVELLGVE